MRMVSYHLGGSSDITGRFGHVTAAVDELIGAGQAIG